MAGDDLILAIDQGTTSSRALVFDRAGTIIASAQQELPQIYPNDGWVEHDPEAIWAGTVEVCRRAIAEAEAGSGAAVRCIGITNQRETAIVWNRSDGAPIHNAVVWQDRRTADRCARLREAGHEPTVRARSGLLLDPYFSATKIGWLLDHVEGARDRAARGDLAFGTVDSFLLWRLTGGRTHATDATNASRTGLYNIHDDEWDPDLLRIFDVPAALLPEVRDSAAVFGMTDPALFGRPIPILGMAGDQQAAAFGQACFAPGAIKATYGTGAFVLLNTGDTALASRNRLLTTIAYRLGGRNCYALEGSIFVAGAAVQWLRDGPGLIESAAETENLAGSIADTGGVYLVPAFTGLGAPWWDPAARGLICGLTRDTGTAELVRAALEAVAYQTSDLFRAMQEDGVTPQALRVDGGMVANDWLLQFLADILALPVDRPRVIETTALGAACLAGLQAGLFGSLDAIADAWARDARFRPAMAEDRRRALLNGWSKAVARTRL